MDLRPYQQRSVTHLRDAIASGSRRPLMVLPPGAGKTIVAANIIDDVVRNGGRCLFLAPYRELVFQTSDKLKRVNIDHRVMLAGADPVGDQDAPVVVAGVDTVISRVMKSGSDSIPKPDLVFVDEAHLYVTKRRIEMLSMWRDAIRIGLTATPIRRDGRGMNLLFDDMIIGATWSELINEGYLSPFEIYAPEEKDLEALRNDLEGVVVRGGDYANRGLAGVMDRPKLVGDVVQHWLELAANRRTIIFAVNVRHAIHIAKEFRRHGIACAHVEATTPDVERRAVINDFVKGNIQILTNCMIASIGFDVPAVSAVVLARPTKSLMLYMQMVGRGLRISEGKDRCLILDHSGCTVEHGPPDAPRDWTLDGHDNIKSVARKRESSDGNNDDVFCPECGAEILYANICRSCGFVLEKAPEGVAIIDGRLVKKKDLGRALKASVEVGRHLFRELLGLAEERGYKRGWAGHVYAWRARQQPDSSWWRDDPLPPGWMAESVAEAYRRWSYVQKRIQEARKNKSGCAQ